MISKQDWKKIRGSKLTPDHIMLSVKGDPAKTLTVTWRTDVAVENGYALYRKKGTDGNWLRADAKKNTFETDVDLSNYFSADMSGLCPDTQYEYTCGDETHRSEVFTFKSARENFDKFSFLCLSDTQTGGPNPPADYTVFGEVVKKILKKHPEVEFIITAGDNTNCGQTDVQWTGLFDGLKGIIEHIPYMMCMGNHDDMQYEDYFTFTNKSYSEKATYFCNQFGNAYPDNAPEDWPCVNYSFDYGNAHFAMVGTSGMEDTNEWLIKDMQNSTKMWKFGAHHFPLCFSGPEIEIEDTYPALTGGMEKCDVFFSGHEHSFARSFPRRKDGLYSKPSEGTIHYNLGSSNRNPPGTRVVPKVWNTVTYEHEVNLSMYTVVELDGDKCTLTAYLEDGRIPDQCVIDKGADVIFPRVLAPVYNRPRIKFKGYDPGICMSNTMPVIKDGIWFVAVGQFMNFIGATVERGVGKIRVDVYGRFVEFYENSDVALTKDGEMKLKAKVFRGAKDQLFVPVDDMCRPLRMHPVYYEHNNFVSVESEIEERPVPVQP